MEFLFTARFLRSFSKLPPGLQSDIESAPEEFRQKKYHEKLKLHKLHGKLRKYHAFSANFSYRIIIKKEGNTVYFMDVGDHSIYE
jgi:mRNA-degrading endonuclease YafQ of YafQ-DinJ toxin-antitoxin module